MKSVVEFIIKSVRLGQTIGEINCKIFCLAMIRSDLTIQVDHIIDSKCLIAQGNRLGFYVVSKVGDLIMLSVNR